MFFWSDSLAAFYGTLRREPKRPSLQDIRATACRWPCPQTLSSSSRGHATSPPSCGTSGRPSADRPSEAMRVTSTLSGSEPRRHCRAGTLLFSLLLSSLFFSSLLLSDFPDFRSLPSPPVLPQRHRGDHRVGRRHL